MAEATQSPPTPAPTAAATTADPADTAHARSGGRRRLTLRDWLFAGAFALYALYALAGLAAGVAAALALPTGLHDTLHIWGFETTFFGRTSEAIADAAHATEPGVQLALDYGFSLLNLALAGLLLWLRPRDLTARLLAVAMVGTAAIFNLQGYSVYEALLTTPTDELAHDLFHLVAAVCYVAALLLFPDGRIVPRWGGGPLALLYVPAAAGLLVLALQIENTSRTLVVLILFGLVAPAAGVAAQAYRYRQSPTPLERQQSRLLFWALTPALVLAIVVLVGGMTESAVQQFEGRNITIIPVPLFRLFQPIFAIIPLALFVGLLRFRLWNVDRLITRTIVYGALAGFVSVVYVGVVVGLGQLIGTRSDNVVLSIIATGIVAIAFEPARRRVQHVANRLVYGRRATPYEALSRFSKGMAETIATEDKLSRLVQVLAEGTASPSAYVWLVFGDELRRAAAWPEDRSTPEPAPVPMRGGDELPALAEATAVVPVLHDGELLGALSVRKPGSESLLPTEEKLMADLAAQAGLVLRNVRLTAELLDRLEELRASRQRLLAAQDEARRRLERNLHDGAQQELVALKVRLSLAEKMAQQGKPVAPLLAQLADATGEAIDNLRDLARGIYPPLLAAEGLASALQAQGRKTAVPVIVSADGAGRYAQDVETAVYFCCLEALQNISKYAQATQVTITLRQVGRSLEFKVVDDGQGFDSQAQGRGTGLQNMADRIDALDGSLSVVSAPGAGTTVIGVIPIAARGAPEPAAEISRR
ncbi:MAG TPA: histidine kinase [Egibacteraceae bacterium]|nr:histidine kinase [Egibacteraceae bacterium]